MPKKIMKECESMQLESVAENAFAQDLAAEYLEELQFAKVVRKDLRTIRRWDALGIGPPKIAIQGLRLYRRSAVIDWLQSHETVRGKSVQESETKPNRNRRSRSK
jgi:hypothetical protein